MLILLIILLQLGLFDRCMKWPTTNV